MATRSNVVVINNKGDKEFIYHHYDGYPSGVGAELNKMFKKNSTFGSVKECADHIKNSDFQYMATECLHADIDYLYTINIDDKTIKCEYVDNWEGLKIINDVFLVNFGSRRQFKDCD